MTTEEEVRLRDLGYDPAKVESIDIQPDAVTVIRTEKRDDGSERYKDVHFVHPDHGPAVTTTLLED